MRLPRTDIYFAADDAHTFLPWLVGILVFLATLLLCLGISVSGWVMDTGSNYENSFTVNIPAAEGAQEQPTEKLTQILLATKGVVSVRRLERPELQEMLEPWLGSGNAMDALPLPTVLDVRMESGAADSMDFDALQATLREIAPGTELDAHEMWVAAFSRFSSAVHSLTIILAVLIISGMGVMIAFTSRAALKLHARTVNLLHSIGAEDRYVTRQFQMEAFRLVLPGALGGCICAGAAYFAAGLYIASLNTSIMPTLAMDRPHYVMLALMPLACTFVAWFVARHSVIGELERSL